MLRLPIDMLSIPYPLFRETYNKFLIILKQMEKEGKIRVQTELHTLELEAAIRNGIKHLGTFHAVLPLKFGHHDNVVPKNPLLVYYYQNRLSGYGLEDMISWDPDMIHEAQDKLQEPV